ncbi:MAG: hypothetical protein AB8B47_06030 [Roseobacter sp.]
MEVILHIGAHRTGTTGFQDYIRRHREWLGHQKVGFWKPRRSQKSIHAGGALQKHGAVLEPLSRDHEPRASLQFDRMRRRGIEKLIVSDENIVGTLRGNLRTGLLYASVGERAAWFSRAFDFQISKIILCPRSLEEFWCTSVATAVVRGSPNPTDVKLKRIAASYRGWRDVIVDLAHAVPEAEIRILPFETFLGRPDMVLMRGADIEAPVESARPWLDKTPDLPVLRRILRERGEDVSNLPFGMGYWNPFTNEQHAGFRELYADDMMWLTAGADGLATLVEDRRRDSAGTTQPLATKEEGHNHEFKERRMARPG